MKFKTKLSRLSPNTVQKIAFAGLLAATSLVLLPVLLLMAVLIGKGVTALSWTFLTDIPRDGMRSGGIYPVIVGTCWLVGGTIAIALPLGVAAAIYLTEYARRNFLTWTIKLAIVNLAGVPSIVYGLFGLGLFVMLLRCGVSMLSGSLTLAILVLPIIITSSQEALASVPQSYREASLALGATRWQTIWHCVLPNALPGIMTGAILAIGRAAGETAPILFTAAAFYLPHLPNSVFDPVMALPYHLYVIATQIPNIGQDIRYATALVLVAMVLGMSFFAIIIRWHYRKKRC
jgi:phosphate transport system permease protein